MKKIQFIAFMLFIIGAWGCSTSKKTELSESEDILPGDTPAATEAQTDAIPAPATPEPLKEEAPQSATTTPAAEPAAEEPANVSSTATGTGDYQEYTVQAGDTLMKIAFETYGDLFAWNKIYDLNKDKISNPNSISKGIVLKFDKPAAPISIEKNGDKYLIKKGDTLVIISDDVYATKAKWKKLWENNKQLIRDPNKIFAGFYLYYTMTPEEKEYRQLHDTKPAPLAQTTPADTASAVAPSGTTPAVPMDDLTRNPAHN